MCRNPWACSTCTHSATEHTELTLCYYALGTESTVMAEISICLCKHIWIRCGITTFLSLVVLLFQELISRLEIYLSQYSNIVKSYWLHLKLLSGCQAIHYSFQDVYVLVHIHFSKTLVIFFRAQHYFPHVRKSGYTSFAVSLNLP